MKKIAIFGSTGSIGSSLLKIIKDDKKNLVSMLSINPNDHIILSEFDLSIRIFFFQSFCF